MKNTVWIIDSDYAEFALIRKFIHAAGHQTDEVLSLKSIDDIESKNAPPSVVFINDQYSDIDRVEIVEALTGKYSAIPIILLATDDNEATEKLAARIGAQDYLLKKEITLPLFRKTLQYAFDRKRDSNELQASRDQYSHIFQRHPLPMWIYEMDSLKFIAVNDAAVYNYGYTNEEFLSMTIKDIRPGEDVPALLNTVNREYKSGFYDDNHWRHIKKDRTSIRVHIYSYPILFNDRDCKIVTAVNISKEYELIQQLGKTDNLPS